MGIIPENIRAIIYTLFAAASVVLLFYGISDEQEIAAWAAAISILGNGQAVLNTSFKKPSE